MIRWFKKHPLAFILSLAVLAVVGSVSGYLPADRLARVLTRPIAALMTGSGRAVGGWFREVGQIGSLRDANNKLTQQNHSLEQQLAGLSQAEAENRQLRAQLKFQQSSGLEGVGAGVINYQPDSVRNFIRINAGRSQGIAAGQPVLAEGYLVGQVANVDGGTSEVMLVNDGEFRVLGKTLNGSGAGLIRGRPPENLVMERIPRDKQIENGALIVTSGLDGQFPAGILIGEVVDISASEEAIFQTAQLRPALDLINLRLVTVLKY